MNVFFWNTSLLLALFGQVHLTYIRFKRIILQSVNYQFTYQSTDYFACASEFLPYSLVLDILTVWINQSASFKGRILKMIHYKMAGSILR